MSERLSDEQVAVLADKEYGSAAWRNDGEIAAHALACEVQEWRAVERQLVIALDNAVVQEATAAGGFANLVTIRPWALYAVPLLAEALRRGLPISASLYDFLAETGNLPEEA